MKSISSLTILKTKAYKIMRIGLVPISGKPYHTGHHSLVEAASKENDLVFLFVSISDRKRKGEFFVSGKAMHEIWKQEIEPIIPVNVTIHYGGSPVRKVYESIEQACQNNSEDYYSVYSDPEDTQKNYSLENRQKYMQPLYNANQVIFVAEKTPDSFTRGIGTPAVSGKMMRHYLETRDLKSFSKYMPPKVNCKNIFDILTSSI